MIFFRDKKYELEESAQEADKYLENLSFEIREPLNSICGVTGILKKGIEEDIDKKQLLYYMDILCSAAEELKNVVDTKLSGKLETDISENETIEDFSILKNRRIMVVEDSLTGSTIVKELLEEYGAIVTVCTNGREAVELFLDSIIGTYDVILMDVKMPEIDGYQATEIIRKSGHPQAEKIPIIAVTAEAFEEDIKKAIRSGMNAHVAKPYNLAKIVSAIQSVNIN